MRPPTLFLSTFLQLAFAVFLNKPQIGFGVGHLSN